VRDGDSELILSGAQCGTARTYAEMLDASNEGYWASRNQGRAGYIR
jgi:hypothetical protein